MISVPSIVAAPAWFRSRDAWTWIVMRFVPPFAALNLAWETAQLPLYDVWEREWQFRAFAALRLSQAAAKPERNIASMKINKETSP